MQERWGLNEIEMQRTYSMNTFVKVYTSSDPKGHFSDFSYTWKVSRNPIVKSSLSTFQILMLRTIAADISSMMGRINRRMSD